jgi:diacylglycerol kinase (ATP)
MRKRARLIYNPTSGNEGLKRFVPDILDIMEQAGYESSTFSNNPEAFFCT